MAHIQREHKTKEEQQPPPMPKQPQHDLKQLQERV
jgi:hypothetical protein